MRTKRKTIKVNELKSEINRLLLLDINDNRKIALCNLIEHFLMETKNYKGYVYPSLFTPECTNWKKENPNKQFYEYIKENKQEFKREYL